MSKFYKLNFEEQNFNCLILKRDLTKPKNLNKPELYLFDTDKKTYVSSLFPASKEVLNQYIIDFKNLGLKQYALVQVNQEQSNIEVLKTAPKKEEVLTLACLDNNTSKVNKSIYLKSEV